MKDKIVIIIPVINLTTGSKITNNRIKSKIVSINEKPFL